MKLQLMTAAECNHKIGCNRAFVKRWPQLKKKNILKKMQI